MTTRAPFGKAHPQRIRNRKVRIAPIARAIALTLAAGTLVAAPVYAQQAFSPAWFAQKGAAQASAAATGQLPNGQPIPGLTGPQQQSQAARDQLQQSMTNLGNAAQAIALQQSLQQQARAAALVRASSIPDGLGQGGLKIDEDTLTKGWINANAPVQSTQDGRVVVDIEQTADKAILNWETFNVGRNTTINFGQDASWSVLNRINDPNLRPSEIQGRINAPGTVFILNRNGILFDGSSQVNVRNLVAAAAQMSDTQFNTNGLYGATTGAASFTGAGGTVEVAQGALIETAKAANATTGGGYVLLLGQEVDNAGSIVTAKGQTQLAAGDSFAIRKGYSTDGNPDSTTRGNEVTVTGSGRVVNSGLLMADTGDVSLVGNRIEQRGVAVSSTSTDTRGTVHLTASGSDANVTLGEGSTTAIVLQADTTALDSQRDALLAPVLDTQPDLNIVPADAYRRDLSLVRITSSGDVDFEGGSTTLATGGQVAVQAGRRTLVRDGAVIDVAGATGVQVAMDSNNVKINVQGNEQRDSAGNRDSTNLNNSDIWVDVRELVRVADGTNGYDGERWYTAGGLLEVGGYLGNRTHSVSEWMALGGTVRFTGNEVVTQGGSQINLSGGTLDVQSGYLQQSWLKGADGKLYEVSKAPGDVLYSGLYRGFESKSERWGRTETFYNPLVAPQQRYENGYTVGRDAGTLVIGTSNAVLEGQIVGDTYQGVRQTDAPQAGVDGYGQVQTAVARGAQLVVGDVTPAYRKDTGQLLQRLAPVMETVVLGSAGDALADGLDLDDLLPADRQRRLVLDNTLLEGLGAVRIAASQGITVDDALVLGHGGELVLNAPQVDIQADITAHGGQLQFGNVLEQLSGNLRVEDTLLEAPAGSTASVTVAEGVRLDASGLWSNLQQNATDSSALPWTDGGRISVRSSGDVRLGSGSVLDVSSGATLSASGALQGGNGGSITLAANASSAASTGELQLDGALRGYGVGAAGTLALQAGKVRIDDDASADDIEAGTLLLRGDFFDKGFANYEVIGNQGLDVAEGTRVDVTRPVYRQGAQALLAATGTATADALELWTPPLYLENPAKGVLSQRGSASLHLQAGNAASLQADIPNTTLTIGEGAVLNVDPGQTIALQGIGQITVDGTLNAWGGNIALRQGSSVGGSGAQAPNFTNIDRRSIWIGENATLDVAARAAVAVDAQGHRYGSVRGGGSIVIGGQIDHANNNAETPLPFVVIREGALLDASGTSAVLDIAGQGATAVASEGGRISMASASGLYLDGDMRAQSGGPGAAGGSLEVAMGVRVAAPAAPDALRAVHELVLGQQQGDSALADDAVPGSEHLHYGYARLGADQIEAGGFDSLSLYSQGMLTFDGDVDLTVGRSLNLYTGALGLSDASGADTRVRLAAPYVLLGGSNAASLPDVGAGGFVRLGMHHGVIGQAQSQQAAVGSFTLEAGRLLEVGGRQGIGTGGSLTLESSSGESEQIDRRAFDDMRLVSQGDMRFGSGTLYASGNLTLAAAQLYPMTGASATVHAGWAGTNSPYDSDRRLAIARTTDTIPDAPNSVFGSLTLGGPTIDQGGILRAPLGALKIGTTSGPAWNTQKVHLLSDSLTSVSADGLSMPYGGTVDGVNWAYDGETVRLYSVGGTQGARAIDNRELEVGVVLTGEYADIREGAVVDLSGGGELLGAAFISGRGGSTDARYNPLMQYGADGFLLPALSTNPVYALVPGAQREYAPAAGASGALDPMLGQQVTIGEGVPGLPAGTYTLLPSTYALLPGAFRVEINGLAGQGAATAASAMRNGSWSASGVLSVAGTGIRDSLASQLILTPADVLRTYSQYNETSYADFVRADATRLGVPRAMLEADAKTLQLSLGEQGSGIDVNFNFDGTVLGAAANGGFGSTVALVVPNQSLVEILADDGQATAGYVSLYASDLSAMDVNRLTLGGRPVVAYGQGGNVVDFGLGINTSANSVVVRSGAVLSAAEVMLIGKQIYASPSGIEIEEGAVITTLGRGAAAYDSDDGFVYQPGDKAVVAISNGRLQWLAADAPGPVAGPGYVQVGACVSLTCSGTTQLYSEGSIAFLTSSSLTLDDAVRYGTRHLSLGVNAFNVGTVDALADAGERGVLAAGMTLNQDVLARLLRGDTSAGAPALETLELTASQSLNFFGTVTLSTLDGNGKSLLDNLMLTTPAIYGLGGADDRALIQTGNLIWNGSGARPGALVTGGAGTGSGTLAVEAERIEFGYGAFSQPSGVDDMSRLALGFANVNLSASERITANNQGSLVVYQSQGAYAAGEGHSYSGGNLDILTPLLTGEAGSVNRLTAGGAVTISAPQGSGADTTAVSADALGAELSIAGQSLLLNTSVALPSGKLTLTAEDDLVLGDAANIDMAGRSVEFFDDEDATRYSWGGDVELRSHAGNIYQSAGSRIDLSAENNQGGRLTAIALDKNTGTVDLQGRILASASGYSNAGGTLAPHLAGGVDIRAQNLGGGTASDAFAALNARLNEGEVFGLRSFQLKQGDLTIGDGLQANQINVSLDGGHLHVNGTVDASGERVGSIRLSGMQGLTLRGDAVLDAHGSMLRVDSYGKIIDSPNRASVELSAGNGQLTLSDGMRIDLRHGTASTASDGEARGTLELNAPRLNGATAGDVAIDASGNLDIQGASSIVLNAVQRYDDASYGTDEAASGRPYQVIDQAYLDTKHADSTAFVTAALGNADLISGKLAGLHNATYADAFHLRPGVEIVSATTDGDMIVSGDLDLSGHRYASLNSNTPLTAIYGSGEVGALVMRAGGDLEIYGSINDGFAPPPETPDDSGWHLTPGYIAFGGDVVVPGPGVILASGTEFAAGRTLNYDLPIGVTRFAAGLQLPVQGVLDSVLQLPAGTVLSAAVRDADGNVLYAAGTILASSIALPAGSRLDAGTVLSSAVSLRAMLWPKQVELPVKLVLSGNLSVPVGGGIPSETLVKLPDEAISVPLRPVNGNRQGANWAVAEMLPEGSQSWSMRFVAGADTLAADSRAVRVGRLPGALSLADTHYSMVSQFEAGGLWYWAPDNWFYYPELGEGIPGTPVPEWALDPGYNVCTVEVGQCVLVTWIWAPDNWFYYPELGEGIPGTPVPEWALDPGYNVCTVEVGQCINIGGSGDLKALHPATQAFSVLRTGTGDLDLIAGGDVQMKSLFGVYTAGTSSASAAGTRAADFNQPRALAADGTYLGTGNSQTAEIAARYEALVDGGADSLYAAWYPDQGGNLLVRAGGNLTGDMLASSNTYDDLGERHVRSQTSSANVGNWLWRQGSAGVSGVQDVPTSWWINFGTYVPGSRGTNMQNAAYGDAVSVPELVGFTGFGTLGGGNLSIDIAGNAGMMNARGNVAQAPRSEGLTLAVGSTGRVTADGELLLTGGGDLNIRIGGSLNPAIQAGVTGTTEDTDLAGAWTQLRGELQASVGAIGGVNLLYGSTYFNNDAKESRAYDPFTSTRGLASGGLTLIVGDAVADLSTRGDLVMTGAGDPGRVTLVAGPAYSYDGRAYATGGNSAYTTGSAGGSVGGAASWFSLWTDNTAINLFSAGGELTPSVQLSSPSGNGAAAAGRYMFPSRLDAVAANGSVFLGPSAAYVNTNLVIDPLGTSILLAPSAQGSLSLLAGNSIYAGGYALNRSGANPDVVPTPLNPAFALFSDGNTLLGSANNAATGADAASLNGANSLFAFGANSAASGGSGSLTPGRWYAKNGDLVGVRTGEILSYRTGSRIGQTLYESGGPLWMMAGRDIVNSGTPLGQPTYAFGTTATSAGNLIVHNDANDVSIVSAGRDILYSSFYVAGPGTLEISAGRNILMNGQIGATPQGVQIFGEATVTSLGAIATGDARPGADIVMQAGLGEGADFLAFAQHYIDPANLAQSGVPLADQTGKVAYTYEEELSEWLGERYGFSGDTEQALAYYAALPAEQQRIFARTVYFAELRAGGREYNDVDGPRFGNYLRGRAAIDLLFPTEDADGQAIVRTGDITLYGGANVRTEFGGNIQMLTPGGQQIFGLEGVVPPSTAGVVTGGAGDIQLYSQGSILLGLSRIMTTFGGDILGWSAEGDINAGRGSKSTVITPPARRVYDMWGNVALSPTVPSTGAGIATLNPIPEVPPGDIDLIAPLGTIDAGEAGIRVSGNVNLAALQVLNADNIQVQGEATGLPVIASINVGALSSASAAANSAVQAAQDMVQRQTQQARPSVISVEVLGFGDSQSSLSPSGAGAVGDATPYDPANRVQYVGHGQHFNPEMLSRLTPDERRLLQQDR